MQTFQVFTLRVSHQQRMVYSRSETLHHPGLYARIDDGTRYDFLEQIDVNGARSRRMSGAVRRVLGYAVR